MAKIIDGDDLVVGTEITIDTTARTFTLLEAGNLVVKDGVTAQALYSKFIKLWETSAYNSFPFPMYAIDAKSGQFEFGFDGSRFNDWGPANDATRNAIRDGGFNEYEAAGTPNIAGTSDTGNLKRRYVGLVSLGEFNTGGQAYYQLVSGATPADFVFDDEPNQAIQIFGDASNGNFDSQTFFKGYIREEGFTYDDSILSDTGQTSTGAFIVNALLSNAVDSNVVNTDAEITGSQSATYANIDVSYYTSSQSIDINDAADDFDFRIIIDGDNKTLQQIYTKVQYLLRQTTDINTAGDDGTKRGDIQDLLMRFEGNQLICSNSVFIENLRPQDKNNVDFFDNAGTKRIFDFAATLQLNFNSFLQTGSTGYFVAYITDSVSGTDDYGTATAIVLDDNTDTDISGTINAASLTFSIDFDNNTQGGRVDADENSATIPITVIAGNKGVAKPVVATATVERSKSNVVTLTAEQDRAYTD